MVEAVIFDWGGTLTPWRTFSYKEQWRLFAREIHSEDDGSELAEALAARILAAEGQAWGRCRTDQGSARLEEILADVGVDEGHERHEAALSAYRRFWEPYTYTDPQVRPLWEGLRDRGVRVGVLSNTLWSGDYHRGVFERDGVLDLIDGQVYSSEIARTKPHPEAFRAAARAVGTAPERAVYVGDRLYEDVHGSQSVGMRAVWVPHSRIPTEQQATVEAEPDAVAHELIDVLEIVDRWRTR